jgi:hypothetical protein
VLVAVTTGKAALDATTVTLAVPFAPLSADVFAGENVAVRVSVPKASNPAGTVIVATPFVTVAGKDW